MHMPTRVRGLITAGVTAAVVSAGALVAVLAVPAAADAPTPPYTAWTIDTERTAGEGTFSSGAIWMENLSIAVNASGQTLVLTGDAEGGPWELRVGPPAGSVWAVGDYELGGSPQTRAYFDLSRYATSCVFPEGTLTVHEAQQADGVVNAFAASFSVTCSGYHGIMHSEIRWNSTVDWLAAINDTTWLEFGSSPAGVPSDPRYFTLTGKGSQPVTFGQAYIETWYEVVGVSFVMDTCSGATLEFGQTCTVGLVADRKTQGGVGGYVVLEDNTLAGTKYVRLNGGKHGFEPDPIPTPTLTPPPWWDNTGTFYALRPSRILDSRTGNGAPRAKLGPGAEIDLAVAGHGGVPEDGVNAVVLNVTVANPDGPSYLTVYPEGEDRPLASSLNVAAGWTGANMVTVGLGVSGGVSIFNNAGSLDVIADVIGFYASDGSMIDSVGTGTHYNPVVPWRLFDSRQAWGQPLPAGYYVRVPFTFNDAFDPHIRALAVNVTAVNAAGAGYLAAWDGVTDLPVASTLNYAPGGVVPNMALVPISRCFVCSNNPEERPWYPSIAVYTNATTHVIIDVVGVYDNAVLGEGLRFTPLTPVRVADSREGHGLPGALGPTSTGTVTPSNGIVTQGTYGLAMNVTAVDPTQHGYVSVWPAGVAQPLVSNLNTAPGQTLPNSVYTLLGSGDAFHVYNHNGSTHIVADVVGTFYYLPEVGGQGVRRSPGPELRYVGVTAGTAHTISKLRAVLAPVP